ISASALAAADYRGAAVSTFQHAKQHVALDCPDLLITAVRLGAFNGLQLVLRVRAECGDLPVIVTGAPTDFTSDIDRYGGRFVAAAPDGGALLERGEELLAGRTPREPDSKRRWLRKRADLPAPGENATAPGIERGQEGLGCSGRPPTGPPS